MKSRLILALTILIAATSAFAQSTHSKTIIIKDGKVIEGSDLLGPGDMLLGGKRAFLGVSLMDLSDELREYFGAPKDAGALVASVEDNSPADKAGLRVGDVIVAVDGKDIDSTWDLRGAIKEKKDGEAVRIDVLRGRNRQTLTATLVEKDFGPGRIRVQNLTDLGERLGETFNSPEWKARVERLQNCDELQAKIKDLEGRLRDLEKKLQK
jgi:membrane-associated protease RseP (regulator of RpoE activity)